MAGVPATVATGVAATAARGQEIAIDEKPDKRHHSEDGKGFINPWDSFNKVSRFEMLRRLLKYGNRKDAAVPQDTALYPAQVVKVDFDKLAVPPKDQIQATW